MLKNFGGAVAIDRNNGDSVGERFDDDSAKRFVRCGMDQAINARPERLHVGLPAKQFNVIGEIQLLNGGQYFLFVLPVPMKNVVSDEQEANVGILTKQASGGV